MKTVLGVAVMVGVAFLAGCEGGAVINGSGGVTTAPNGVPAPSDPANPSADPAAPFTVDDVAPRDGALGVARDMPIVIEFARPVACATIDASSVTLSGPSGPVAGTWQCAGDTATFTPSADLDSVARYTVMVRSAVTDLASAPLTPFLSSFTTARDSTIALSAGGSPLPPGVLRFGSSANVTVTKTPCSDPAVTEGPAPCVMIDWSEEVTTPVYEHKSLMIVFGEASGNVVGVWYSHKKGVSNGYGWNTGGPHLLTDVGVDQGAKVVTFANVILPNVVTQTAGVGALTVNGTMTY